MATGDGAVGSGRDVSAAGVEGVGKATRASSSASSERIAVVCGDVGRKGEEEMGRWSDGDGGGMSMGDRIEDERETEASKAGDADSGGHGPAQKSSGGAAELSVRKGRGEGAAPKAERSRSNGSVAVEVERASMVGVWWSGAARIGGDGDGDGDGGRERWRWERSLYNEPQWKRMGGRRASGMDV